MNNWIMICPHCRVAFHAEVKTHLLGKDTDAAWAIAQTTCAACRRFVLFLQKGDHMVKDSNGRSIRINYIEKNVLFHPKGSARPPVPTDVPTDIGGDYVEACLVLPDSPKASAALSRRCLQHLLRSAARVKPGDLANEIQQVLDARRLPSTLAESIDAVRNIGNFAAHPMKSKVTGEIADVEPGEAEWNLDVLEGLFDFYFVQPALMKEKRTALDAKLAKIGKPPMKSP